jgi:hypothetical protein
MPLEQQLLERTTAPGDSYWFRGECIRRPYAPVNYDKWSLSWDELMTCPDTPLIAYLRPRYEYGSMAKVGMR